MVKCNASQVCSLHTRALGASPTTPAASHEPLRDPGPLEPGAAEADLLLEEADVPGPLGAVHVPSSKM